jgi:hypothetical protein
MLYLIIAFVVCIMAIALGYFAESRKRHQVH